MGVLPRYVGKPLMMPSKSCNGSPTCRPWSGLEAKLVNGTGMMASAALDDRDGGGDVAAHLEETEQQDGVAEITEVDVRADFPDQAMLAQHQHRGDALLVQVGQHLVHLQQQVFFARHRLQISVEAIDHHKAAAFVLNRVAKRGGEFPGDISAGLI